MRRRDGQFVRTPLQKPSSQEHAVLTERVDRTEIVLEEAIRESLLVSLAHDIAAIPKKQRTALLIELANRVHFNVRPSLMQEAFLEADIRLQDYQQSLPNDPSERRMHRYQVQLACKQIMKKQKRPEEQHTIEVVNQGQGPTSSLRDPDANAIQNDPELVALGTHLDATAPFAAVSPTFRQALRHRLLERLSERRASETMGKPPDPVPGEVDFEQQTQVEAIHGDQQSPPSGRDPDTDSIQPIGIPPASVAEGVNEPDGAEVPTSSGQEPTSSPEDPEPDDVGNNPELALLVARLNATAPSAMVDPVFRNRLRKKLLGIAAERYIAKAGKEVPDSVAERGVETGFQEAHLVSLVHEIVDFPDEERTALLIDLANRTHFDVEPTPLQQALQEVGIRLQDYASVLPDDPLEWRNHNFFLNRAYKRVIELQEALCTSASAG
jgi:hypothetical protein